MMSEKKLSVSEIKRIAHQIIDEEEKKWNIELDIFPFTFIEYYTSDIFKKRFKLSNALYNITLPFTSYGINDMKGNSIIFLNQYNRYIKTEEKLFQLLVACYHEYRHSIQEQYDICSYEGFLYYMDEFVRSKISIDYDLDHDKYSYEIGANLYSVGRAKEYMINNYPDLYEKQKKEIEALEQQYIFDYMTFDPSDLIERVIKILKFNNKIQDNKFVSKINKKSGFSFIKKIDINDVPAVLKIFLDDNFNFKPIKEIKRLADINSLDERIIYYFLSSNSFLESIDLEKLSDSELQLINQSVRYTYVSYINQKEFIEKQRGNTIKYFTAKISITNKINKLAEIIEKNILSTLNIFRNDRKRREHVINVESYLEESNNIINKRNI